MNFEQFSSQIDNFQTKYKDTVTPQSYFGFPIEPILKAEKRLREQSVDKNIAYFSMEFGIAPSIYNSFELKTKMSNANTFYQHEVFSNQWLCDYLFKIKIDKMLDIPIYGGGLGVLAGDTVKSAADLDYPVVALGILWNKGYFKQNFWYKHGQVPEELQWDPHTYPGLIPLNQIISLDTKEGQLHLRLWKYYIYSYDKKSACPMILLDSNLEENSEHFRKLTDQLYRADDVWWKIFQRVILGVGGMKALNNQAYNIDRYHLNEGHAAFALIEQYVALENKDEMADLRKHFAYTCHTPVAAGHDRFMIDDVSKVLNSEYVDACRKFGKEDPNVEQINLTFMCLDNCDKVNAVAQKHGEITRLQFPAYAEKVDAITNGVHLHTWLSKSYAELLDKYQNQLGDWRREPKLLEKVMQLKENNDFRRDIFEAHQVNKRNLMQKLKWWKLDENVLTVGWARRIAGYKRPGLIVHNIERIRQLAYEVGPLQIILAGKAHPNDDIGSAHIEEILDKIDALNQDRRRIKVLILENYDTYFGKLLTSSVDVWLNNPLPPFEASGTSGMKAILNGVLQCSTLDGWVVEAEKDDIGWIFGYRHQGSDIGKEMDSRLEEDSDELYQTMEEMLKLYYDVNLKGQVNLQSVWIDKMIHCVARGAFFNTQRMIEEYNSLMWHGKSVPASA